MITWSCVAILCFGLGWILKEKKANEQYIDALTLAMITAMPTYFGVKRTDAPSAFGVAYQAAVKAGLEKEIRKNMVKYGWPEQEL